MKQKHTPLFRLQTGGTQTINLENEDLASLATMIFGFYRQNRCTDLTVQLQMHSLINAFVHIWLDRFFMRSFKYYL